MSDLRLLCALLAAVLCSGCAEDERHVLAATLTNSIGMELRLVPAGSFRMGTPQDEPGRLDNEGPAHAVRITRAFYLGTTEVTNGQIQAFVDATGYRTDAERDAAGGFGIDFETAEVQQDARVTWRAPGFPGFEPGPAHPAVLLSWQDAEAFCRWLSEQEGRTYRLPTEAEWEYAARAGTRSAYATGNAPRSLRGQANIADATLHAAVPAASWCEAWDDGHAFLAPVGSYPANAWGLHDMHGNVWEWCADWYAKDYYARSPSADPPGPKRGRFRAIRGGGWFNAAAQQRSAQRIYFDPRFRYCLLSGFRVLLETSAR